MYAPAKERYETMEYNRCGESGLMLPKVSLGLWHNFGDTSDYENMKQGAPLMKTHKIFFKLTTLTNGTDYPPADRAGAPRHDCKKQLARQIPAGI